MAIKYRAAQIDSDQGSLPLTAISPHDTSLPPDIPNPAATAPTNIQGHFPAMTVGGSTPGSGPGLVTETAPLSTSASIPKPTSIPTPTPITISVTSSATPTHTAAASPGISPGKLTAAIVVPIAILAILIPVLTYWFLNHKRKLEEKKYASHRDSNTREPMIQKQLSYRGPAPEWPQRIPNQRHSSHNSIREPPSAHTRNSLGLFNFELSPNTPTSPPGSREYPATPHFNFSIARALEMRRSQPSIVQPHARTSNTRVSRMDRGRPPTRGSNRNSRSLPFDPPPPYASPRPSESAAARSHFAPLSRIGTRHLAERSPPQAASPSQDTTGPDRSTYASSDVIASPESANRVHARLSSPSLEWPSPPRAQDVVHRKPVPSLSLETNSQITSHLDRPFSSYLPESISDDASGFSIHTSRWEDGPRQDSAVSSIRSQISSEESSTVHPHHMV